MSIFTVHSDADYNMSHVKRLAEQQSVLLGRLKKLQDIISKEEQLVNLPVIHVITPTYRRFTQKADLTRLSQTFMHVPNLHWIVVEDSGDKTPLVATLLKATHIKYTHLSEKTQSKLARKQDDPQWQKHKGVDQRNTALRWVRDNIKNRDDVVYFADDDNTYDLNLFKEVRLKQRPA